MGHACIGRFIKNPAAAFIFQRTGRFFQRTGGRFQRIHRSYLVNLSLVREFTRTSVILEGGVTLPVSDLYRTALREALGKV